MSNFKNTCDYGHDTNGQVRVLPLTLGENHSNLIVCKTHYWEEIKNRIETNKTLSESAKFKLPEWFSLKVYDWE